MKQIFLYCGIMLVVATGVFCIYYRIGRFNNIYGELHNRMEEQNDEKNSVQSRRSDNNKTTLFRTAHTTTEEKIIDTIFSLPEVKERISYIEKETKGARHLRVWIFQRPKEPKEKYFWVKVDEDNGTNFVTHYNFFVYPDNLEIKYFDIIRHKAIDLLIWRIDINKKNGSI